MALGIPCLSTDCRPGGARTLIKDGINGFVIPRKDTNALAEKMLYILTHPDVSKKISEGGRKIAYTHNEKETFDKWEAFLGKIEN